MIFIAVIMALMFMTIIVRAVINKQSKNNKPIEIQMLERATSAERKRCAAHAKYLGAFVTAERIESGEDVPPERKKRLRAEGSTPSVLLAKLPSKADKKTLDMFSDEN